MSLLDEGREGRLRGLEALRDRLAVELDGCESSRDVAALSIRFMDVLEQISELSGGGTRTESASPSSPVDEFTRRRRSRGA